MRTIHSSERLTKFTFPEVNIKSRQFQIKSNKYNAFQKIRC